MSQNSVKALYEDNHVIAVYKPAGVLVQGDISGDVSLLDMTKEYLKEKYGKPGNVFLGLVHRLDRNVAGIVLFAKTSKGASRLSEQFRLHTVEKIYHAWVEGSLKKSAALEHHLMHDERRNLSTIVGTAAFGAVDARLAYEVVEERIGAKSGKPATLVRITLETGRHHQIRAQMAHIGHPILGDVKYGAHEAFPDQHLALYATEIHFDRATMTAGGTPEENRQVVSIPIPQETW